LGKEYEKRRERDKGTKGIKEGKKERMKEWMSGMTIRHYFRESLNLSN
jgi:hypothetical protein